MRHFAFVLVQSETSNQVYFIPGDGAGMTCALSSIQRGYYELAKQ